ncbi:MAG: Tim44-like domain-containing protein [Patescibacteria group bacterium]|jgi:predicted lipid-binding transport protein (Tim44 family)|nr:Tim44-like domain-containing protein [Patescibacteria group bacterium]
MKKLFTLLLVALFSFGLATGEAGAKRFGGGTSFGKQRQSISPSAPKAPASAPAAGAPAKPGGKWLGPLAGLAAGGLLASLFMGHGFEGIKMMDILIMLGIAAAIFFIFRSLRRNSMPQASPAGGMPYGSDRPAGQAMGSGAPLMAAGTRPAWFEDEPFLRQAKGNFIRLQDANDKADLNDIREFTTPEVFAEISLQIQERGGKPQHTEIVALNAEMADVVTEGDYVIASVRFSGQVREEPGAGAEPFNEIWHIQKALNQPNGSWFIAGIQQV